MKLGGIMHPSNKLEGSDTFHIYKTGPMTVVGFEGKDLSDPIVGDEIRDRLLQVVDESSCQVLVVDMMKVGIVSSWILGVLAAVKSKGVQVELYHPSRDIRDVLSTTHLDQLLHVRDTWDESDDQSEKS